MQGVIGALARLYHDKNGHIIISCVGHAAPATIGIGFIDPLIAMIALLHFPASSACFFRSSLWHLTRATQSVKYTLASHTLPHPIVFGAEVILMAGMILQAVRMGSCGNR